MQEARVRNAPTEAEVKELQALQPWRCALEKDPWASGSPAARCSRSRQPAELKALEALQTPGHEKKADVGGVAAAPQLHHLEALEVLGNAAQAAVGDLLAEAQVKGVQRANILH
jgi:hypothetical protein